MCVVRQPDLPDVRRLEAVGFRAWPAAEAYYDGTWMVRLTAGHPSGRLNSINPMDPADDHNLDERINRLSRYFRERGRIPSFRLTPLSAPRIGERLDQLGWISLKHTVVMRLGLTEQLLAIAEDLTPTNNVERYVEASITTHADDPAIKPGLRQVLEAIKPDHGLFILDRDGAPVSSALCVRDVDVVGLFNVATAEQVRGQGFGRRLIMSALRWAFARGARQAYLQVEEENQTAIRLYRSLGFSDAYRYVYRQPQDQAST